MSYYNNQKEGEKKHVFTITIPTDFGVAGREENLNREVNDEVKAL
jgi:hypothetical protein